METNAVVDLILYLVVAIIVYFLAVQIAFWAVPRRHHWIPGIVLSFAGALVGAEVVARLWPQTPLFGELFGAGLGALGFIFFAVKVGTPGSVVLTVNCSVDTALEEELVRSGNAPPFVWPYHLAVEKQGTVIWELRGEAGTVVVIEFKEDDTPFGTDRDGKPRARFEGTVPGRIVASPTVTAGRGSYTVTQRDPSGGTVSVGDPSWDIPRRNV